MPINSYPESKFQVPAYFKYSNPNADASDSINLFFADAINIDFRVQGIIENSQYTPEAIGGYKYIIGNGGSLPTLGDIDFTPETNDIIVYNDIASGPRWELLFRASNSAFGASGGAFAYVIEDQSFYGFNGEEWGPIAAGSSGPKGDTGESVVYGVKYTLVAPDTDAGSMSSGQIVLSNTTSGGFRTFKIHQNSSLLGANFDLFNTIFPEGTSTTNTTKSNIFLYNKTKQRTYGFRFTPSINGIGSGDASDVYVIDGIADYDYYKILIDESTALQGDSDWGSGVNSWQAGDEIFVYAVADGVAGSQGDKGATGSGITLAASSPENGELIIQYIGSDGSLGATAATGIVSGSDGVTGDPGEVGLYMYFTGGAAGVWENSSTSYTEATLTSNTPSGNIRWGNNVTIADLDDQDVIAVSSTTYGPSPSLSFLSFNMSSEEFLTGNWYNRPGTLMFYTFEDDYNINLRSFVSYEKIRGSFNGNGALLLTEIGSTFGSPSDNLGIAPGEYGFILPIPAGIRGTGVTFGELVNNTLYLDYYDADGNTFGRFAAVQGISGADGQMNPFNIPYVTTADGVDFGSDLVGFISVGTRAGGNPLTLRVSATDDEANSVLEYINQAKEVGVNSGYITVFSRTNARNYGLFRFATTTTDSNTTTGGVRFEALEHLAGPLTAIVGTPDTGLPEGSDVLFALSIDGKRGFSGEVVGYTFGIEYFIGSEKPTQRGNGDPIEIGDKWYCTTVGLEFTFLGGSGDIESVVGHGDSGDNSVWVQTNNARQGRRGPKGEQGEGFTGAVGATGINYRGVWNSALIYNKRDVVYTTYNTIRTSGSNGGPSDATFWTNGSALPEGTTAGAFICIADGVFGVGPGDGPLDNQSINWQPFTTSEGGPAGQNGTQGIYGTGVVSVNYDSVQDKIRFNHQIYDGPSSSDAAGVFISTINASDVRGPTGPTGPIGGSVNHYMYRASETTVSSTNRLKIAGGYPTLTSYVEQINSGGVFNAITTDQLKLTTSYSTSSSIYINLDDVSESGRTITELVLDGMPDSGAQTIIFDGVGAEDGVINLGTDGDMATVTYKYSSNDEFENVYFSVQAEIDTAGANIIRLPRNNEAGILTARRHGADLYITYVLYDKVK